MNARKILLFSAISALVASAVLAIASLWIGDFGELQIKILGTTSTIAFASFAALTCAAFRHRHPHSPAASGGIALVAVTGLLVIAGIWGEIDQWEFWRIVLTAGFPATALAYALPLQLLRVPPNAQWLHRTTAATVGILAILGLVAIWGEIEEEHFYRMIGAISVLTVLQTLVLPILAFVARQHDTASPSETGRTLHLAADGKGWWVDEHGRRYRVTPELLVTERAETPAEASESSNAEPARRLDMVQA
jgi:hypothetical protein